MFGPDDVRERLAQTRRWPERCPPDQRFVSDDASEQFLEVRRAPLERFPDAIDFWIVASGYRTRFDWRPLCRTISQADFVREFGWLDGARWVNAWRPRGTVRGAMMMVDDDLDTQVICVTDREYYLLDWYTTA